MAKKPHSLFKVIQSLGWPFFWGSLAFAALSLCIQHEVITNKMVVRYVTAHPVSYVTTLMFCVGIASLLLKSIDVFQQFSSLDRVRLDEERGPEELTTRQRTNRTNEQTENRVDRAEDFLARLEEQPDSYKTGYLWKRLRDVLQSTARGGGRTSPDEELKYLSDMDASRQQDGYALVRILIWATPMLGFLGTVIGISEALGGLNVGVDKDFEQMMSGLRESLYVAFDTTALALTLSIFLMFGQFLVDRFETQLLNSVDHRASEQIGLHFQTGSDTFSGSDPYLDSVKRMSLMVLKSIEQISQQQADVWKNSVGAALHDWQSGLVESNQLASAKLSQSFGQSLQDFTKQLQATLNESDARVARRWEQWQVSLSENARTMHRQQEELVRQAEMLDHAIKSCGDVMQIQDALNENLSALSRTENFEQMIVTLSAAINLLSVKLDKSQMAPVRLHSKGRTSEAA